MPGQEPTVTKPSKTRSSVAGKSIHIGDFGPTLSGNPGALMDYLIILAIVAIALLLTGLTNLDALRRPFRPKTKKPDRPGETAEQLGSSKDTAQPSQTDKRPANGPQ